MTCFLSAQLRCYCAPCFHSPIKLVKHKLIDAVYWAVIYEERHLTWHWVKFYQTFRHDLEMWRREPPGLSRFHWVNVIFNSTHVHASFNLEVAFISPTSSPRITYSPIFFSTQFTVAYNNDGVVGPATTSFSGIDSSTVNQKSNFNIDFALKTWILIACSQVLFEITCRNRNRWWLRKQQLPGHSQRLPWWHQD